MLIVTPSEIESITWEGQLVSPDTSYAINRRERPVATIGRPEVWAVEQALETQVGQKWSPPMGDTEYWLVRFACTLRQPTGFARITEAELRVYLRPKDYVGSGNAAYAFSLYPDRVGVETEHEFSVGLGPELKFATGGEFKIGEIGATITYKKVFPVIQSYGAGESSPYWVFKPHGARPIEGSQFVYAVLAASRAAQGMRASVDLVVAAELPLGLGRFGLSDEARTHTAFSIP